MEPAGPPIDPARATFRAGRGALTVAGAVVVAASVVSLWIWPGLSRWLRAVPARGTVVVSEVAQVPGPRGDLRHVARVEVAFQWRGERIVVPAFPTDLPARRDATARRRVADHPVGAARTVNVDPVDPRASSLEPGADPIRAGFVTVMAFALWLGLGDLASALAAWRALRGQRAGGAVLDVTPLRDERWLGPRIRCGTWLCLIAACAVTPFLPATLHPLALLAPPALVGALAAVPAARLGRELRRDLRWRTARLARGAARDGRLDATVTGLAPRDAATLDLAFVLSRAESGPDDDGDGDGDGGAPDCARRAWVVTALAEERVPVDLAGGAPSLTAPIAPFGPPHPLPDYDARRPGLHVVDGRVRRVRVHLRARAAGDEATFAWPPEST